MASILLQTALVAVATNGRFSLAPW